MRPLAGRRAAVATALAVALGAASLPACATTYDETLVDDTTPATTTTLPTGPAGDLLPRLADEATGLSAVMIAEGDDRAVAERIAALWDAARAEVRADRPELVDAFDQNVALVAKAVQFRRAADADKAAKNLTVLVDAYVA